MSFKSDSKNESLLFDKLENLRKDWRDSQNKAAKENSKYGQIVRPNPVTLSEVQNVLDTDTILLEYSVSFEGSVLWAITKEQVKAYKLPGQETLVVLDKYLKTLRQPLMTSAEIFEHVALGQNLYQKLLAPAETLIFGKKRVIIAPDGALYYLPFEALIASDKSKGAKRTQKLSEISYLIKKFEVVYIPSASILVEQRKDRREPRNTPSLPLLAFGDPIYETKSSRLAAESSSEGALPANISLRGLNLNPLEFSGQEVKRIANIWGISSRFR